MRTNLLVQTFKVGAKRMNLNRTTMRVALIGLFISLGIGNALASSNYYASLKIDQSGPTGAGSVYVANSNSKPGTANPGTAVQSAATTTSGGNVTMYWWVDINPGYNVSLNGKVTGGPYSAASANGNVSCAASTSKNGVQAYTATATFVAVTVNSVDAASKDLAPTNPSIDYPFTVTFETSNLKTIALDLNKSPETADGKFTITSWAQDGNNVVATGKFNGGGSYGGASRTNSTIVSLQSKASGSAAKTCTVTANFPAMAFVSVAADDVYATQGESGKTGSATFKYNYAAEDDFPTAPTLTPVSGTGALAITGYTVTPNFSDGTCEVTVDYTYDTNNGVGDTEATLTLTAVNGDARTVTIVGHSEAMATNDASVTPAGGSPTEYATFTEALTAANGLTGSTLTLLRNVDLGTITTTNNINKAMTIDLNGKELRAAVNATDVGILTIAKAVAVTIKDSKTGGKIINEIARNSAIRTIFVNKAGATLTLESGTIAVNNLGQYASAANSTLGVAKYANCTARAIHQIAGTTVNINGGRVEAYGTRSVYGIVQASSAATNAAGTSVLNITSGEIYAEGPYNILGVNSAGKVNFSGGTITSHVTTNMVDARYAADATQNKYNGYGYGIYMTVSASATATSCYFGTLSMTGGTINVTNDRTYNGNYPNYGVFFNAAAANVSSATAVAADGKSRGQIASATGSITGGEINVTSGTQYSYGVYVLGSYNSYDNTNHVVQIKNCKITSKAYVCAYGVSAWVGINSTNGACYAGDVELTDCDIYAESLNTSTAAAVWVASTSSTIFKDGTTANAATWGGEFAVAGKAVINSGKYEAKTKTTTAMAVGTSSRAKTTYDPETTVVGKRKRGGAAEAYPTLIIHGGTFNATSTTTTARGVSNGGYCTIDGGEFNAYATTTTAQGLYCLTGKITASGVKITSSATGTAYGALADAGIATGNSAQPGYAYAGELELNNCDITATTRTGTEARGVVVSATNKLHNWAQFTADSTSNKWAAASTAPNYRSVFLCNVEGRDSIGMAIAGKATINGGKITATAATTTAYGVYAIGSQDLMLDSIAIPELTVRNAKITVATNGTTSAWGIYTQGKTLVDGCDITVTPKTTTGYGIQALAANDTKVIVRNTKITVNATTTAYGLQGYVDINTKNGQDRHGNFVLEEGNDVTVNATSGNSSYAVHLSATKRAITAPATTPTDISAYRLGDYANAATAVITGGKYKATATGTTAYAIGLVAQQNQNGVIAQPECVVNNGKFWGKATGGTDGCINTDGKTGHAVLNGGFYNVNTNLANYVALDKSLFALSNTYHPEYDEGYRYIIAAENPGGEVCKVYQGNTERGSYRSLVEALQYVNANSGTTLTIVMTDHHTLPAGDYLLPVNATLLVPYKTGTGAGATAALGTSVSRTNTAGTLSPFKKLTFASGANMTVQGKIETSAQMLCANGGQPVSGCVTGPYGQLHLQEGAHIDLESTATLYAWGYITGDGVITAKKNSKIYEDFVLGYWRGGSASYDMMGNSAKAFFVTDYAYQNIECPVVYKAGAMAYGYSGVYAASGIRTCDNVGIVGTENALFKMDASAEAENAWVKKEYNASEDRVYWTMKSGASISNMKIKLSNIPLIGTIDMDSKDYNLPITSNFTITMLDGRVNVTNDVLFMPGSQLFINKEATAVVASGKKLYFYDNEDWQMTGGKWYYPITYSPSWGNSNPRVLLYPQAATTNPLPDAEVFIHGTMEVNGQLFTTGQRDASLAGRSANIHSTNEDAGTIVYTVAATADGTVGQCISTGPAYVTAQTTSARLKNGNGAYTVTSGTGAGYVYEYENDQWVCRVKDGCMTKSIDGSGEHYFAKPSDVVEVAANATDEAYHGVADPTRYFIYAENNTKNNAASATATSCVWWECEHLGIIDGVNYYKATNENFDNYGTYYYFDEGCGFWKPKCVTVTWTNWDGTILKYANNSNTVDQVPYNTSPVYLGQNPTRTNTATEKYDWVGWRDANGNIYTKNDVLPLATADVTYTAYYNTSKFQYTITFKNEDDNKVIWSGLIEAGNPAVCPVTPTQASTVSTDYTFTNWSGYAAGANLPEVTGSTTYIAQYSESPRKYHVTFYNYDAATVLYEADVDYNTRPVYDGVTPFRANTSAFSYEWTGWRQGANTYDTDDDLAFVTGDVYYVATFSQTDLKYQVLFKRQDGSIIDAPFFNFEETPTAFPENPTLASTVSTDYTFDHWDPATLTSVTEDGKVYTAYFSESPRQYTAHFVNYNGTSLNADQTIDYNTVPAYTGVTPMKPNDARNSYEFSGWAWAAGDGWEAGSVGLGEALPAIKGEITFTAQYNPVLLQFDVIYQREDGTVILRDKKKWGESSAFPTSGLDYEDATYTYTFDHWSPATVVNPITTNATYTAYFNQSVKSYSISTIATTPAGYGTVSPASLASIPGGSTVTVNGNTITVNGTTITATPAAADAQYTYTFDHWNNVPATVTGNVTNIEAVFTRTVNQYDVTFNMKGHGAAISSQTKDYGSKVDQPADPSEAGYTFVGWYKEDACTNAWNFASDEVTDATTLFAKWTVNSYTITFDGNGGSEVASITQNYGTEITPPANPTRTGYTFAGWDPAVPATMPVDGETCVAQWTINSYQVKFVDEDGTTNLGSYPQTLDYGTAVTAPEEPTKAADATNVYTFAGWSDGVSTYASADIPAVSGAVTYTATYNSAPTVASVTVGGATTYYATLQAAFDYAADKTTPTIKALADIALTTKVTYTNTSKTTVTIDLNGHTVAGKVNQLLYLTSGSSNGGQIVIKSSVVGGQIRNVLSSTSSRSCVYLYKGKLKLESGTIYCENTNTGASYALQTASRTFTMTGGQIEARGQQNVYALCSAGTSTVSGGRLVASDTKTGTVAGVCVLGGTTTISGSTEIEVNATANAYGARVSLRPSTSGTVYNGTLNITGGTFNVHASNNTALGVYSYAGTRAIDYATNATYAKNYACAGTANISGGEFTVTSDGAKAYGVYVTGTVSIATAKDADGNATYASASATSKANITGGKFNVSGTSDVMAVNTSATNTDLVVEGGWYNVDDNLSGYVAPTKDCNYWVLPLVDETYKHEVAEAYAITFNNWNGDELQSGAVKKGSTPVYAGATPTKAQDEYYTYSYNGWSPALVNVSATATYTATFISTPRTYNITLNTNGGTINADNVETYAYGTGATLPTNVTKDGHTFGGWFDNTELAGDAVTTISTTATGDKTFWAKWISSGTGPYVDIVDVVNTDASSGTLTLNVTNWPSAGWPYTINGTSYASTAREDDRTLIIPYPGAPGADFVIDIKKGNGDPYSLRSYKIPEVISSATLEDDKDRPLFVKGGTLTINGNITTKNIYVGEDAKLVINKGKTLTADTIFLRTTISGAAQMVKNGSIASATKLYYTRIIKDKSRYYQFGLPLSCSIDDVKLSDGKVLKYSSAWLLREYSESSRAQNGGSANNWTSVADHATIMGGKGYEMFSASNYYREFYFPVDHTQLESNTSVAVSHTTKGAATDRGWNVLVSPLTATCERTTSPEGVSVCWMESDGWGVQEQPTSIPPAKPFAYQAYENQSVLSFLGANIILAPRRVPAAEEPTQIQWIHLDVLDANRIGDQTSIYVHPTRYEEVYQGGIDVAKQALTASRAVIYSSHAYGDMAFAGVADSLLETGVALTVYSPKAQELMITMRENDWLDRMEHVWLVDRETGMRVDLLWSDYAFRVQEGTTRGRLFIEGAFRAPQVTTDIEPASDASTKGRDVRKVIINDKIYILVNGRMYDSTGKLVKEKY